MGSSSSVFSSLLSIITTLAWLVVAMQLAESKTYWADVEVMKQLKNSLHADSMSPGSCLSSWDFNLDPCDNLFGEKFTCGFRCDLVISESSRVTELALDQAGYSGSLSSISWNLPYLQTLDLSNNYFSGSIPDSLSNLTRLTRFGLSRNSFSGSIPTSIGSLSSLEELYLDNNNLEGPIPASFNNLYSLKRLEIQSNNLTGQFPDLGSLKDLSFLDTSDNAISGQLPSTLPPSLVQVSMRNNNLQGTIPESLKLLNFLQVLDLSHNSLTGSVPSLLFNHPSLQQLTLSSNHFTSIDPPPLFISMTTSQLIAVDMSDNNLQGLLPLFLSLIPSLSALSLENNKFTGMIPTQYAVKVALPVSGVAPFERLLLGGNYLYGPIPGPFLDLKPGSANLRLADNCLYRCPLSFFFCQGADQKSLVECKKFSPAIP